jgi:ADP-ribosylglycohydrolase
MPVYETIERLIEEELIQRREEGCSVKDIEQKFNELKASQLPDKLKLYERLLKRLENKRPRKSLAANEPSTLEEIRALRPEGPRRIPLTLSPTQLQDRILGAWLGRAAGCLLGKPCEGWTHERIHAYLKLAGAWPLDDYWPIAAGETDTLRLGDEAKKHMTRGNVTYMVRDDDTDYTVLGLHILEKFGRDFTPRNVADTWLLTLPYHMVYTAERVAYRNFVDGMWPPDSASYRNPYREWIGAQIRADGWGCAAAGDPELAAEFAWRDASVSHVKNGIYGEMFCSAMIAAAFSTSDVREVVRLGLSEIPAKCRLARAAEDVLKWSKANKTWEETFAQIMRSYGSYHPVHTINNAALVLMGLLHGEGDLEKTTCIAVMGGLDTDCNGATAGSVVGAMLGASRLPSKWITPLNDTLMSAVIGFNDSSFTNLASRTTEVALKIRG